MIRSTALLRIELKHLKKRIKTEKNLDVLSRLKRRKKQIELFLVNKNIDLFFR